MIASFAVRKDLTQSCLPICYYFLNNEGALQKSLLMPTSWSVCPHLPAARKCHIYVKGMTPFIVLIFVQSENCGSGFTFFCTCTSSLPGTVCVGHLADNQVAGDAKVYFSRPPSLRAVTWRFCQFGSEPNLKSTVMILKHSSWGWLECSLSSRNDSLAEWLRHQPPLRNFKERSRFIRHTAIPVPRLTVYPVKHSEGHRTQQYRLIHPT